MPKTNDAINYKVRPLPWKITSDGLELNITDAKGDRVLYGNINRGIEYDDPDTPGLLGLAIDHLNQNNIPPIMAPTGADAKPLQCVTAACYGIDGIDMMAMLAAVMDRYKDLPDHERRAGLQWFASKYGSERWSAS